MGQCDLVLVNAPDFAEGLGLTVHFRTKARREYSYIESAAIKIGKEDIFELGSFGQYFVNGISNAEMPSTIAGFPITHDHKKEHLHVFTVDLDKHGSVILHVFKDLVGVKFKHSKVGDFATSVGLMGDFASGAHLARDMKTVLVDNTEFGQEWQVLPEEPQLFMTKAPEGKCVIPLPKTETSRKLGEGVSKEAAEEACAHVIEAHDQCVYDVIATGDVDIAQMAAL